MSLSNGIKNIILDNLNLEKLITKSKLYNKCLLERVTISKSTLKASRPTFDKTHVLSSNFDTDSMMQINRSTLVTGSTIGDVYIWDLKTYQLIKTLKGHKNGVSSLLLTKKKELVTFSDNEIKIWSTKTYELIRNVDVKLSFWYACPIGGRGSFITNCGNIIIWNDKCEQIKSFVGNYKTVLFKRYLVISNTVNDKEQLTVIDTSNDYQSKVYPEYELEWCAQPVEFGTDRIVLVSRPRLVVLDKEFRIKCETSEYPNITFVSALNDKEIVIACDDDNIIILKVSDTIVKKTSIKLRMIDCRYLYPLNDGRIVLLQQSLVQTKKVVQCQGNLLLWDPSSDKEPKRIYDKINPMFLQLSDNSLVMAAWRNFVLFK
jgi:WD40 repeat protein